MPILGCGVRHRVLHYPAGPSATAAGEAARCRECRTERREKAWLATGFFQKKTFTLSHRTDSLEDQEVLFELVQREKFKDGHYTRAMGPESNVFRITTSTNDMVIWDRIMKEFDKPHKK